MTLAPGTRLGPYQIKAPLGAGGMGEVYRARDTRLGRDVAVKVLPQHLSSSPEDRARFKREAKTISSLNHPHICVLHDVGQEGETDYLVMELVEGETLAQGLARGPLPTADVLKFGAQIADALDRAHRAGVTHRDLKPGNVMLTKNGAKLMDFGLARASGPTVRAGERDITATAPGGSPKPDEPITAKGTVVGTFQYMAPEQLEGKATDARSDIWALGCVLYEMATGKRAFEGSTPASLISAIMRDQPRVMTALAPLTPPALERVVIQCLAKDPDQRWQTAGDLSRELQWIAEGGSQSGLAMPIAAWRNSRRAFAWSVAVVATLLGVGLIVVTFGSKPRFVPAVFEILPPREAVLMESPCISPDSRFIAVNAADSADIRSIWVRKLNSLEWRRLSGTENAFGPPFWSPDSRFLAFFCRGKVFKINITDGSRAKICDAVGGSIGAWGSRGAILFDTGNGDSIKSVSSAGGAPAAAIVADRKKRRPVEWPQFLPDGRHFLYVASGRGGSTLMAGCIGSKQTKPLETGTSRAEYASGHLLYERDGALVARQFDPRTLKFHGAAFTVVDKIETGVGGLALFSASKSGTLVYRAGEMSGPRRLVWTNRRGGRIGTVAGLGKYGEPTLSPDGTHLAFKLFDPSRNAWDIWTWDLARDIGSRLTFSGDAMGPAWSPDGRRVVYGVLRDGAWQLRSASANANSIDSLLLTSDQPMVPGSMTSDGRWLTYMTWSGPDLFGWDMYMLSMKGSSRPVPLVVSPYGEGSEAISPDGKWVAYISDEAGRFDIYVQSFPNPSSRWRISSSGGLDAAWRGDSRELYYVSSENKLMAVTVSQDAPPHFSSARVLFTTPMGVSVYDRNRCAVTRDGQKFLFVVPERGGNVGVTTVVQDWLGKSKER